MWAKPQSHQRAFLLCLTLHWMMGYFTAKDFKTNILVKAASIAASKVEHCSACLVQVCCVHQSAQCCLTSLCA